MNNKTLLIILLSFVVHFMKIQCTKSIRQDFKNLATNGISRNVSRVLNQLLKGYDKRIRPNYSGPPVVVGITININNINSVSEVNMDYSLDIFFRQLWVDKRLSFDLSADGINELVIGSDMLHRIWLPDTFIANDKKTYFHKATVQNKFIRINPDGQVLYSMRMTVTAACPMNFRYFPMDHQVCDLEIESYGFRIDDIKYKWGDGLKNASALHISPDIELPQLKYKDSRLIEREFRLSTGLYSRLTMKLYFVRSLGYYIIQIYLPSSLIVALSWVSFWLDISAAPARITLGMTTVLTMVTFIWSTNASLPKISYIKGIDVYLVTCFVMTFSSVIEYAVVSFIYNRVERRRREKAALAKKQEFTQIQNQQNREMANSNNQMKHVVVMQKNSNLNSNINNNNSHNSNYNTNNPHSFSSLRFNKSEKNINNTDYEHQQQSFLKKEEYMLNNKSLPILIEKKCRCKDCGLQPPEKLSTQLSNSFNNKRNSIPNNRQISGGQQSNHSGPDTSHLQNKLTCTCNKNAKDTQCFSSPIHHSDMPYKITVMPQPHNKMRYRKIIFCQVEMKAITIDKYARAAFPLVFITFHVVYWTVYLTISSSLWHITTTMK